MYMLEITSYCCHCCRKATFDKLFRQDVVPVNFDFPFSVASQVTGMQTRMTDWCTCVEKTVSSVSSHAQELITAKGPLQ